MKIKNLFCLVWVAVAGVTFGETLQERIDAAASGATISWSGSSGPIVVRGKALTIVGDGTAVIDGGGTQRCADLGAEKTTGVTLKNFTLQNGSADWGGGAFGGRLVSCRIIGCKASLAAGAYGATLEGCTVSGNQATEAGSALGNCTASDCTLSANVRLASASAISAHGGLVYGSRLTNCTVSENTLSFGNAAPVKGAIGYQVTMTKGQVTKNTVTCESDVLYGTIDAGDFAESTLTDVKHGGDTPGPGPGPGPEPEPEQPEPPVRPETVPGTAYVGIYHYADLADICAEPLPTGRKVTVKGEGLPKGLKLTTGGLALEGVPTETLNGTNRMAFVRVTADGVQTLVKLNFRVLPAESYEKIALPSGTLKQDYPETWLHWYWPGLTNAPSQWSVSGLPGGLKCSSQTGFEITGKPTATGWFTVKLTEKIPGTSYKSEHLASLAVWSAATGATTAARTNRVGVLVYEKAPEGTTSAKGLPTGVKLTSRYFYGTPTKAGTSLVTCTLQTGAQAQFAWTIQSADEPTFGLDLGGQAIDARTGKSLIRQGVAYGWPIDCDSSAKVSVSGQPTGLKLTSTKYPFVFGGVPTKAGDFVATFKVTAAGQVSVNTTAFTVQALPTWAQGTFVGGADSEASGSGGQTTFTVSKDGKLSGQWLSEGKKWTLSAPSYARYVEAEDAYVAELVRKSGSGKSAVSQTNELYVTCDEVGGLATNGLFVAYQNLWKQQPWQTIAKGFKSANEIVLEPAVVDPADTITLKVATTGAVTAKGKFVKSVSAKGKITWYSVSASSVLCPQTQPDANGAFDGVVFVYFPPKAGTPLANGYSTCVKLRWEKGGFTLVD